MEKNESIVLYMNDGVPCGEFTGDRAIVDAYNCLQECKRQDKEMGCKGIEYYFGFMRETGDALEYQEVKIYKRGNKVFMKHMNWETMKKEKNYVRNKKSI